MTTTEHDDAPIDIAEWLAKPAWMQQAACRGLDPNLFHPNRGEPTRQIKQICGGCPVRNDCLDYAMCNGEKVGIWGGLSERERRRLRHDNPVVRVPAPIHHGTIGGYDTHRRRGETQCTACADAHARYMKCRPDRPKVTA